MLLALAKARALLHLFDDAQGLCEVAQLVVATGHDELRSINLAFVFVVVGQVKCLGRLSQR